MGRTCSQSQRSTWSLCLPCQRRIRPLTPMQPVYPWSAATTTQQTGFEASEKLAVIARGANTCKFVYRKARASPLRVHRRDEPLTNKWIRRQLAAGRLPELHGVRAVLAGVIW